MKNQRRISYHQTTTTIKTRITTAPALAPITIHFKLLLLGSAGTAATVGDGVGVVVLVKASISEMFAPIADPRTAL